MFSTPPPKRRRKKKKEKERKKKEKERKKERKKATTSNNNTHENLIKYSDHLPPTRAKFKNNWSYTSVHHICHHGLKINQFIFTLHQGCTNSAARSPRQLNFIWWCLIFVGTHYGTDVSLLAPGILRWLLHFWKLHAPLT
jgi:hypothetical protein